MPTRYMYLLNNLWTYMLLLVGGTHTLWMVGHLQQAGWQSVYVQSILCVAVPCRNRKLFHRVFWSNCCLWSAISLNFRQGWGSYALHSFIKYSCIYEAHISPTLNRSSAIRSFKHSNAIENTQWNNLWFLYRTATCMVCGLYNFIHSLSLPVCAT